MMKARVNTICLVVAIAGLLLLPLRDAVAGADSATKDEGAVNERSMSQAGAVACRNPMPCCPHSAHSPSEVSRPRGIGERINGFLAFGCRLNYRLTDWALSDKCDTKHMRSDSPRKKVPSECVPGRAPSIEKQ